MHLWGLSSWGSGKESACQCRRWRKPGFDPWVRNIPWREKWQPIPVLLPGKSRGQRSLVGYSPHGPRVRHNWATKNTTCSPTPRVYSNSCPLSRWCHLTVSSSVVPFSSHLQSFPASGSFPVSQFFPSGGQSIGVSTSASVLPMNIQDWFPLGWTGWISLQSKGLSRVFSSTTVQKHQFFRTPLSFFLFFFIYFY